MSDSETEVAQEATSIISELNIIEKQILIRTVRTFLSTTNTSTAVTKTILQKNAWLDTSMARVKLNVILGLAEEILRDVYGYAIRALPPREAITSKGARKESSIQQWILVNVLDDPQLRFYQEASFNLPTAKGLFCSELSDERHDYRNNREEAPVYKSDQEQLTNGLILTILSLLIVHSNKMDEHELLDLLKTEFGVDPNQQIPILDMLPQDFLKHLDRMDYVTRLVIASDNGEPVVEYSVGRRAKMEFTRDDFVGLLRILYDINDAEEAEKFSAKMAESLEPVYGKPI